MVLAALAVKQALLELAELRTVQPFIASVAGHRDAAALRARFCMIAIRDLMFAFAVNTALLAVFTSALGAVAIASLMILVICAQTPP